MTQNLETLQNERENLARQIKELDRQIKFVQNNVPKCQLPLTKVSDLQTLI